MTPSVDILPCVCGILLCPIYGFCHCGCGLKTSIPNRNCVKSNTVKGRPRHFIGGHNGRIKPELEDAVPFKIEEIYCRLISLSRNQYTIVDAADYEWLMQWKWYAVFDPKREVFYAKRAETRNIDGKNKQIHISMHRQILGFETRESPQGDHNNLVTLDNRRNNLRPASHAENCRNRGRRVDNTSGFKGVTGKPGRWFGQIEVNGKTIRFGPFPTKEEAHAAYCKAAVFYYGEFARFD